MKFLQRIIKILCFDSSEENYVELAMFKIILIKYV